MSEKNWSGAFVNERLGVNLITTGEIPIPNLVGLALRHNRKRAHLLVSKVLGKHIPTDPHIILAAARVLAVQVGHTLTGESSDALLRLLASVLEGEAEVSELSAALAEVHVTWPGVAIGYAETATALGAAVAEKLSAPYIHSTRYPAADATYYGAFEESHSHATSHHLTPATPMLDTSAPLVLIDDELTSGSTAMNTIRMLHAKQPHQRYVIATLIDMRGEQDVATMAAFANELGVPVDVVALGTGQVTLPAGIVDEAEALMESVAQPEVAAGDLAAEIDYRGFPLPERHLRDGVATMDSYRHSAAVAASNLPDLRGERVLVLGDEEDMYLPLLAAADLRAGSVLFSSTTRSPVFPLNRADYAIRSAVRYSAPEVPGDTSARFSYNIGTYDRILLFTTSQESIQAFSAPGGLLEALRPHAQVITIMQGLPATPSPLVGPSFGSYAAGDVMWLLKDLSDVKLEAPIEEREEAIQNGGAHYSESLPVEYQPTDAYQQLFTDSLAENAAKLAEAVATVSSLILQERPSPVLVSLARAGVPVGALIKRYLGEVHNLTVPHYGVSIIRGKGIDYNAMNHLAANHRPEDIIFIDGWTGKGAITVELTDALERYRQDTNITISPTLAVLADPGRCVEIYGTREDYLIPSACLNSTVSGLISRTVHRPDLVGEQDYHGAKFYREFTSIDRSNEFLDAVQQHFQAAGAQERALVAAQQANYEAPDFGGWREIEALSEAYGINNVNLVKPGVGETTRVLLRRVPWRILIRRDQFDALLHIRLLAESRGVEIEQVDDLTYSCVGLIHPKYTRGATGFDGGRV